MQTGLRTALGAPFQGSPCGDWLGSAGFLHIPWGDVKNQMCVQIDYQRKTGRQGAAMGGKEDASIRVRATVHFLGTPPSLGVTAPSGHWAQTSFPGLWVAYSHGIRAPAPLTSLPLSMCPWASASLKEHMEPENQASVRAMKDRALPTWWFST